MSGNYFVGEADFEANDSAGDGVAGIGLGTKNIATVAFPDGYVLSPGNPLKRDKHYLKRAEQTNILASIPGVSL